MLHQLLLMFAFSGPPAAARPMPPVPAVRMADSLYARYQKTRQRDLLTRAVSVLQPVEQAYPGDADVRGWLGFLDVELGDYRSAVDALEPCLTLEGAAPQDALSLGLAYEGLRQYGQAEGAYTSALGMENRLAKRHRRPPDAGLLCLATYNLGHAAFQNGEFARSAASYQQALELRRLGGSAAAPEESAIQAGAAAALLASARAASAPGAEQFSTLFHRAEAEAGRGQPAQAEAHFKAALAGRPDNVPALLWLGKLLIEKGDAEGALQPLLRAAGLQPASLDARKSLGLAYLQLRQDDLAAGQLEQASRLSPPDAGVQYALATALARLGRYPEAEACYRAALTAGQTAPGVDGALAQEGLGAALQHQGRLQDAVAAYASAAALAPGRPDAWLDLGMARLQEARASGRDGDFARAADSLGRAAALLPQDAIVQQAYAEALARSGQAIRAADVLQGLAARGQAPADAMLALGNLDSGLHRLGAAAAAYRASADSGGGLRSLRLLGQAQWRQGDYADAAVTFGTVAQRQPGDLNAWIATAAAFNANGDSARAIRALEQAGAAPARPDRPDDVALLAEAHRLLADSYLRRPDTSSLASAEAQYSAALKLEASPQWKATCLAGLAIVAMRRGRDEQRTGFSLLPILRQKQFVEKQRAAKARISHSQLYFRRALELLRAAQKADPGDDTIANDLGAACEATGDLPGALHAYRRALALNPSLSEARANLQRLQPLIDVGGPF